MADYHQPVLLEEAIHYLALKQDGVYIDATFGRGGHAKAILDQLSQQGKLLAIDKDPEAILFAKRNFTQYRNFYVKQGSFTVLQSFVNELGLAQQIDGILLDLGVSSPQLDEASRGFSFLQDGPLDMRMDPAAPLDAATWLKTAEEKEIADVLFDYGEERFAKRIAKAIVQKRAKEAITRTTQLADIVKAANPAWEKGRKGLVKHPATRVFQAIRIYINRELDELQECLRQCLSALAIGGRLVVISFHSLEDRIVKHFIQTETRGGDIPRDLPLTEKQLSPRLKRIAWGVKASESEVRQNPRARSAILRVAEKLQ